MQLKEIIEKLNLKPLTNVDDREVDGVFMSDMLSDVMTGAKAGALWITVQTHSNIVSAANLIDIAAVVVSQGKTVPEATIELANRYHVIILSTTLSNFEFAGKLIEIGVKT